MLNQLVEYATRNIPHLEPGFGPKKVKWRITITQNGTAVVEPYGISEDGLDVDRCPEFPANLLQRGGRCHFLVETLQVVLLMLGSKDDPGKYQEKHNYFIELLLKATRATPELKLAAELFNDTKRIQSLVEHLKNAGAKPTDKVFFTVDGLDPLNHKPCITWWSEFRKSLLCEDNNSKQMLCFMTGENVVPTATHSKISGLKTVGGRGQDILIGFDKKAFESFGLEQSSNCAMSEDMVNRYTKGLDDLIAKHSQTLAGAKVVHWFKEAIKLEDDPISFLFEPPEQTQATAMHSARQILESLRNGQRPVPVNNRYFAITLSGASGRVMVRDWMEGCFDDLIARIEQWFSDLEIVAQSGGSIARDPKFNNVCVSMVRYDKTKPYFDNLKKVPAPTATTLWRCALMGQPIPQPFLAQALMQFRSDLLESNSSEDKEKPFNHARMGLMKAYFIRKGGNHYMSIFLNKEHPDAAYQCGRLLAVLADLQRSALGDVGAGVVQRYYMAASQSPGLMLGRLIGNAKNHLNKLEGGLAYWYEDQISEIMSHIQDQIPATLNLERQGLFALGYYQQIAARRTGSKNTSTEESKGGDN